MHGCVQERERASEVWRKRGSGWDRGGRWEITRIGVLNRETTKDAVAEIPLITDTMLLLAVTPPPCPPPPQATIIPPPPFPSTPNRQSFVNNHSYMQTKGRKMQVPLLNARDFLIPSYFMFWKSCCSFLSFLYPFFHSTLHAQANSYTRVATLAPSLFFEGKNCFKPKLSPPNRVLFL